ncbi:unnamed protein product [Polarella glacialis]|uniref:Uncharacterized protein n=1 Tax=Polarella glacialis TaxID=89957 RepID=A0A813J241_POLGL|nr:unnamed protein product [Polarella glacialis]
MELSMLGPAGLGRLGKGFELPVLELQGPFREKKDRGLKWDGCPRYCMAGHQQVFHGQRIKKDGFAAGILVVAFVRRRLRSRAGRRVPRRSTAEAEAGPRRMVAPAWDLGRKPMSAESCVSSLHH